MIVATRNLSMEQRAGWWCSTLSQSRDGQRPHHHLHQGPGRRCLQPLHSKLLGFFTVAELVELCPPYGRGHLGWPPCEGSWRWSQEGGLVLIGWIWGRRRSRMRAQQGGARIYIFIESESFFSKGQSIFGYCSVLEKACWPKDLEMQYIYL